MTQPAQLNIVKHFEDIKDPRVLRTQEHKLVNIIIIAICGVICNADSWVDIETFGNTRRSWFSSFLELSNGIPSHDTFGRVFALLNAKEFESAFRSWITELVDVTGGKIISIDGKTLRRSHNKTIGKEAIHIVSAWAHENHVTLGQLKVEEKSNEITAIPELLKLLTLKKCTVTIDAMGCQTDIAEKIVEGGGEYVLALKENQETLLEGVKEAFVEERKDNFKYVQHDSYETIEKGHGRVETRRYFTISDTRYLAYLNENKKWKHLSAIGMVECERWIKGETTIDQRYYLLSSSKGARYLAKAVRTHWGIENNLHWMLDVVFHEDDSRIRTGDAGQNFSLLRRIALMLLKKEPSKGSIHTKRLKAGWDENYLLQVLTTEAI